MLLNKIALLIFFVLVMLNFSSAEIVLDGVILDNGAEPVQNAFVQLVDREDTSRTFSDYTNDNGQYRIRVTETGIKDWTPPKTFRLYQNYPNPFNPLTVIKYSLAGPAPVRIDIFNVRGQKIRTLHGLQTDTSGRVVWNATDDRGDRVSAGIYIYSLVAGGKRINRKMVLIDDEVGVGGVTLSGLSDKTGSGVLHKKLSNQYILEVSGENIETYKRNLALHSSKVLNITVIRTVTDIDGHVYRTVKIGDQWWMAENLKATHYRNGDPILKVKGNAAWIGITTGAYCNYNNDETHVSTYGRLYNFYAVADERSIAPQGWHVPSDEEWKQLEMHLGISQSEADDDGWRGLDGGGKLKEAGTAHWLSPNTGANNKSGFSALPAGYRLSVYGKFSSMGNYAFFWSASKNDNSGAWSRSLNANFSGIGRTYGSEHYGFSVRCLKDE